MPVRRAGGNSREHERAEICLGEVRCQTWTGCCCFSASRSTRRLLPRADQFQRVPLPAMSRIPHHELLTNRRDFLRRSGAGFGAIALAALMGDRKLLAALGDAGGAPANPMAAKLPHTPGRAKNVIFLFMEGGPSHLDICDPKPLLNQISGQPLPDSFGKVITAMGESKAPLLASKRTWKQHGESGLWFSDWVPHMAELADDWCQVRSCVSDGINHAGGVCQMNTGAVFGGRPSLGSWVSYGLGTENQDMPSFVVMKDTDAEVTNGV